MYYGCLSIAINPPCICNVQIVKAGPLQILFNFVKTFSNLGSFIFQVSPICHTLSYLVQQFHLTKLKIVCCYTLKLSKILEYLFMFDLFIKTQACDK